jgi:large subunit ribosomal protein L24
LRIGVSGADAGALFTEGVRPPAAGRLTFQAEVTGTGRSPAAFIGSLAGSGSIKLERAQLQGLNPAVFETVVRASEIGLAMEGNRLRDFVGGVLDNASLPVPLAEAAININAGQARLSGVSTRTTGADLALTASLDLTASTLDAVLTLTGLPGSAAAERPAVLVALRGPLPEPRRVIDTSPLARWLTMRSVDRQSRQLDAIERARRSAVPPAERDGPQAAPPRESAPAAPPVVPQDVPSAEQAPPLPPPVQIPSATRPRADSTTAPQAPPATPSGVPRPPGLVGAQR